MTSILMFIAMPFLGIRIGVPMLSGGGTAGGGGGGGGTPTYHIYFF